MAQIQTKFIAGNAIDDTKIRLRNNQNLRGRNAADNADVDILKINTSDRILFASVPQSAGAPVVGNDLANKTYVDSVAANSASVSEVLTLSGTDITNQYKDTSAHAYSNYIDLSVSGVTQTPTTDYTTATQGSVTRITFAGDLATAGNAALISGDKLVLFYVLG